MFWPVLTMLRNRLPLHTPTVGIWMEERLMGVEVLCRMILLLG